MTTSIDVRCASRLPAGGVWLSTSPAGLPSAGLVISSNRTCGSTPLTGGVAMCLSRTVATSSRAATTDLPTRSGTNSGAGLGRALRCGLPRGPRRFAGRFGRFDRRVGAAVAPQHWRHQHPDLLLLARAAERCFAAIGADRVVITEAGKPVDQLLRQHAFEIAAMYVRLLMMHDIGEEQMEMRIP